MYVSLGWGSPRSIGVEPVSGGRGWNRSAGGERISVCIRFPLGQISTVATPARPPRQPRGPVCDVLFLGRDAEPAGRTFQLLVSDRQQGQRSAHPVASWLADVGGQGVAWQWANRQDGGSLGVCVRLRVCVIGCVVYWWAVAAVHTVSCNADSQGGVAAFHGHVAGACGVMLHMHIDQKI